MLNSLFHLIMKESVLLACFVGVISGKYILFNYLRERNWKRPNLKEIFTPSTKEIELIKFVQIAIADGWKILEPEDDRDNHQVRFNRILREAAIEGVIVLKGRENLRAEFFHDHNPLIKLDQEYWKSHDFDLFSYSRTDNKETKTIEDQNGTYHYDLHVLERSGRRWLNVIASGQK